MDITKAAERGWNKETGIIMWLRNLTPKEFRKHSNLDNNLRPSPSPMIYYKGTGEKIKKDPVWGPDFMAGEISVHQDPEEPGVSLSTNPNFNESEGYEEFVLKMVEYLGGKKENVHFWNRPGIWNPIGYELWNGADLVGHEEIADLAEYFQKEYVDKYKKGCKTRIFTVYDNLNPIQVLRMEYSPRKVVKFEIAPVVY